MAGRREEFSDESEARRNASGHDEEDAAEHDQAPDDERSRSRSEGLDTLNVGDQNGEFVLDFLREEGIPVVARDLYDVWPRKVYFFPRTGKVLVKKLRSLSNDTVGRREQDYFQRINQVAASGDPAAITRSLPPCVSHG